MYELVLIAAGRALRQGTDVYVGNGPTFGSKGPGPMFSVGKPLGEYEARDRSIAFGDEGRGRVK